MTLKLVALFLTTGAGLGTMDAGTANGDEKTINAVLAYLAESPALAELRPTAEGRHAIRLLGCCGGAWIDKLVDGPTKEEIRKHVRISVFDYLVHVGFGEKSDLVVSITPLGRTLGRLVPRTFVLSRNEAGDFTEIRGPFFP
jgi:hypothetical protein